MAEQRTDEKAATPPGPEAERLKIDDDPEEALQKLLRARERQGGNVPNESDLQRQQQYPEVLRDVAAGDTLGPPQTYYTNQEIRKFERSGKLYLVALIQQMIAENLLDADEERGVIMAAEGQRFLDQYG